MPQTLEQTEKFLKPREFAEALSVSVRWLTERMRAGEISGVTLPGGRVRIPASELRRLTAQQPAGTVGAQQES